MKKPLYLMLLTGAVLLGIAVFVLRSIPQGDRAEHVPQAQMVVQPPINTSPKPPKFLQVCPDSKIANKMPTVGTTSSEEYFVMNGARYELDQFDLNWVATHCTVPTHTVY